MQKILPFFLIVLISCSSQDKEYGKKPENMLSQPQMVAVLTDMQAAEGTMALKIGGNLNTRTAQKNAYQVAILKKHGISQDLFWENYQYYTENPKLLDTIYAQVVKELEKQLPIEKERMAKNPPPTSAPVVPVVPPKPIFLPPNSANKAQKGH